jgi:hypothetical protein
MEQYGQFANFDSGTGLLISPSLPRRAKERADGGSQDQLRGPGSRIGFAATLGHAEGFLRGNAANAKAL